MQGIAQEQEQEQQDRHQYHHYRHHHYQQQQQITSGEGEEEKNAPQATAGAQVAHILGTPPPVLPPPQFDTSFSLESMFESSGFGSEKIEKIEKLNEEKGWLDERLKEMQARLARAEKKTEEMETKRRSQMLLR